MLFIRSPSQTKIRWDGEKVVLKQHAIILKMNHILSYGPSQSTIRAGLKGRERQRGRKDF